MWSPGGGGWYRKLRINTWGTVERKLYQKVRLNNVGFFLGHLAPSLDHLWNIFGHPRATLGHLRPILRQYGNILGAILGNSKATLGHLAAILGQSWNHFGAILGHLEPSWGYLGSMPQPLQNHPKNH